MFVGSSVYIFIFIALGRYGGLAAFNIIRTGGLSLRFLLTTALLVLAAFLLRELNRRSREVISPIHRLAASRRRSVEAALLAGLGANAMMALVITWLLELISLIAQSPPERALLRFLEIGRDLSVAAGSFGEQRLVFAGLVATIPFQVVILGFWALMYALAFESRLRGTAGIKGVQFSLLPWLFDGLVTFPLLGTGIFGWHLHAGLLPALGELARHAIYGICLGTLYRLIRLARQPRPHEGYRHGHRHLTESTLEAAAVAKHSTATLQRLDAATLQHLDANGITSGTPAPANTPAPSGAQTAPPAAPPS